TALQFLAVALLGAGPWVIAAFVTVWSLARRRAWRDPDEVAWTALAIWVLGVFGMTALSPFRLSHYGLPASFGIALLAARGWALDTGRRLALAHAGLFAAIGLGLVASHRAVRDLARSVARLAGPEDVVAHEGPIENSGALEWYAGRRPVIVDGRRSVLGFGAERPEARDLFWDAARLRGAWAS